MKILLSKKNSKWKVVQNVLTGNYYTDVVSFRNDDEKDQFLQQNVATDWRDLTKYINISPTWEDEIHFSFTTDLKLSGMTKSKALRCDFAIVYDENDKEAGYRFYSLTARLNPKQNYSTISFVAELDVFFTYDIKNIWKPNAQIASERRVFNNQWLQDEAGNLYPNIKIGNDLSLLEETGSEALVTSHFAGINTNTTKGLLLYFKPSRRKVNFNSPIKFLKTGNTVTAQINGIFEDCVTVRASATGSTVDVGYLVINTETTSDKSNNITYLASEPADAINIVHLNNYPPLQRVEKYYKKSDKYVVLWLDINKLSTPAWTFQSEYTITWGDLLNSPELLKIEPTNEDWTNEKKALLTTIDTNTKYASNNGFTFDNTKVGASDFWFNQDLVVNYQYIPILNVNDVHKVKETFVEKAFFPKVTQKMLTVDYYDYHQYAKLANSENLNWSIVDVLKNQLNFNMNILNATNDTFTIENQTVHNLSGRFSKVFIQEMGLVNPGNSLRNPYVLETDFNLDYFQNTDKWLDYAAQNQLSINQQSRRLKSNIALGAIGSVASIALSATGVAGGIAGGIRGAMSKNVLNKLTPGGIDPQILNDFSSGDYETYLNNRNRGLDYNQTVTKYKLHSEIVNKNKNTSTAAVMGLGNIVSGVKEFVNSIMDLKELSNSLAIAQTNSNIIKSVGGEYEKLIALDNPYSYHIFKNEQPEVIKKALGYHFHRFGYNNGGRLESPLESLNKGVIFDYIMSNYASTYQALNETVSPQEAKIIANSIEQGVRVWHWTPDLPDSWEIGNYRFRNIKYLEP